MQAYFLRHYNIIRDYKTTTNFIAMETPNKSECLNLTIAKIIKWIRSNKLKGNLQLFVINEIGKYINHVK